MGQLTKVSGRATSIVRDSDGTLRVAYHATNVVTVHPDGSITLDSGGWHSATTKARMNQAACQFSLGYSVYQRDFAWFVEYHGQTIPFDGRTVTLPADGAK